MKITELLELIRDTAQNNVNQNMLAKAWGVTRQSINNRIRNNSEITISELRKAEEFFSVNIINNVSANVVRIDYYPDVFASCGSGVLAFSEEKATIELHKTLISNYSSNKKYSMIHAKGDSMVPYINDGDRLIIEHLNENNIIDNKVYVFCYNSEIFVKRLYKNIDEIIIKSENPNYDLKKVKKENMNDISVIGQVVGIVREI